MAAVSGSKSTTSDKVAINNCSACEDGKIIIEATMFCGNCKEYMCTSCAGIHRSFKQSRGHTVVSVSDISSQGAAVCQLSFSTCAEHGDRDMDLFCDQHEVVLCDSCKIIKHRKCKVVSFSSMKNDKICKQQMTDDLETMSALESRIDKLNKEKKNAIVSLNSVEKSCLTDINTFKTKLIQIVEILEGKTREEAKKEMDILQSHIRLFDALISQATVATKEANSVQSIHDISTNVIAANRLRTTRRDIELTLSEIQTETHTFNITFFPSLTLSDLLRSPDPLGTLYVHPSLSVSGNVSASTTFINMQLDYSREIKTSLTNITSSAVLPNGDVILISNNNSSVILLDKTLNIKSTLKLPSRPWDVASYEESGGGSGGGSRAIVSMPEGKQLQWIYYTDAGLRSGGTITTKHECYYIAVHNSEIYVRLGDSVGGNVKVMDSRGRDIRTISCSSPYIQEDHITVSSNGTVYISDFLRNRILYFTSTGDGKYKEQKSIAMTKPRGMLLDGEDNILVCCERSDDIHVLEKDGTDSKVVLSSKDCLSKPQTMWYRGSDKTLVVVNATGCRAYVFK